MPHPMPSVGRIVHYTPHPEDAAIHGVADGPHPAIVTEVRGSDLQEELSLIVFFGGKMGGGGTFAAGRCRHSYTPIPGTWHWPPRLP